MGGGLAFLNKKGWHPGSMRNQEKVWAREQERDAEQRKLEELKEAIEVERQQEEMRGLARKAGIKQNNNAMDWMYQGGMGARQEADKRVGEAVPTNPSSDVPSDGLQVQGQAPPAVQLPAFLAEDNPASANEVWVRLHNDPLFAIRQQEIAARKSVMANPVKMDAVAKLKQEVERAAQEKAARKQAKKEAKAAKKAKKRARKEGEKHLKASSSDDSDVPDQPPAKAQRTGEHDSARHRDVAHADARGRRQHAQHSEPPATQHNDSGRDRQHAEARHEHRDAGRPHRTDSRRQYPDDARQQARAEDSHGPREGKRERERATRDHPHTVSDRGDRDRHRHDERRSSRVDDMGHGVANARGNHVRESGKAHGSDRGRGAAVTEEEGVDGKRKNAAYGLRASGAAPQEVANRDRDAAVLATRENLQKAVQAREEEERLKASQRYVKKEYKAGGVSEEDRARRLAEMSGNASVHEEARWQRLSNARKKDQQDDAEAAANGAEEGAHANGKGGRVDFMKTATHSLYGSSEGGSVQDQVGRRAFYSERDSDKAAFRR